MLTFLINELSTAEREVPGSNPTGPLIFNFFFPFFNSNKKNDWNINENPKIRAKLTIIVVENREPNNFIIIYKCKEIPLSLFSYEMLASTFDSDERSSYYKVYDISPKYKSWWKFFFCFWVWVKYKYIQRRYTHKKTSKV